MYWTIDSKERLFTGSGEGEVTFADAMALLDALAGAKALSYRKLFDGRAVQSPMTGEPRASGFAPLLAVATDDADVAIGLHVSRLDIAAVLEPLCAEFGHQLLNTDKLFAHVPAQHATVLD